MGYRSEAAIAFPAKYFNEYVSRIHAAAADKEECEYLENGDHNWLIDGAGGPWKLIAWMGIKWYDTYPSIQAIEAFLKELGVRARYARVSEDEQEVVEKNGAKTPEFFGIHRPGDEPRIAPEKDGFCIWWDATIYDGY